MPVIELTTEIHAPIERIFDLARSVELHMDSTGQTAGVCILIRLFFAICATDATAEIV